jgi:hypothetical protein
MFFWNARRVQLTPDCRNEDSAARLRVQKRPAHCASAIVSSPETSNMRRPGGIGPCRSDIITMPPLRTNAATVGIATSRCASSRCIRTAVSMTRSNSSPRARTAVKCGRLSSSHSIVGDGCSSIAPGRSSPVGSTATTECPRATSPAASRPVPAPISRVRRGVGGIRCTTGAWHLQKKCSHSASAAPEPRRHSFPFR